MRLLRFNLDRLAIRLTIAVLSFAAVGIAFVGIVRQFAVGRLADRRLEVRREMIANPATYLEASPRINARLAEAELVDGDRDLSSAKLHARLAVEQSPFDFKNRILLASIEEAQGDKDAAEKSLEDAQRLAPNDRNVHW